ncbi:Uncharacterized protein F54H12.2 [Stylophora pistillata]|uniref:Uncharacterized protein F54H12.2 n=1 Tax=Stylophora pistillata TaxID=50429 RepID=A0A2B4R767_STYPI|nr:Uncharacterized protein F54H12.2 [Stylophora pistillata]
MSKTKTECHEYESPGHVGSLGGIQPYAKAQKISHTQAQKELEKNLAYTLHKPRRRRGEFALVIVFDIDEQWVADLIEVETIAKENKGYRYILVVVDAFSKYAWAVPLKKKTGKEVTEAFRKIVTQGRKPQKLQMDAGNANLTAWVDAVNRKLAPCNNLAHSLFKQINVKLNGMLITEQVDMYHLKAYIQTLLNYNRADGETILASAGWRNEIDSPETYTANDVKSDEDADFGALSANQQASILAQKAEARDYYAGGKCRVMRMKPFVDIFHQGKWLAPGTEVELKFYLNPSALYFNAEANPGAERVRQHVDDIKLTFYVCLVSLNPSVYDNAMSILTKTPAKYPIVRTEMGQFPLDNAATYKEIINPFNGKIPQRIVLGILATTAFNGQADKDPFAFGKFGVEWVKQIWNGDEYPYEMMDLNTGNGYKDMTGYHGFLEATGCLYRKGGNMVRFADWGHGKNYTLFAWSNVANGRQDNPILLPKEAEFINIQLKCAAQAANRTIMIYSKYESMLEIDGFKGGVSMDVN